MQESAMLRQNLEMLRSIWTQDMDPRGIEGLVVYGLGSLQRRQSRYQVQSWSEGRDA